MALYEPIYLVYLKSSGAGVVLAPGIGLFIVLLVVHRAGAMSFSVFANTLIAGSVIIQTLNICTTGGPSSILIAGYIDILMLAALLVGRRSTYIWTAVIIIVPLLLGTLELNGLKLPYARLGVGSEVVQLAITIGVIIGAALFVLLLKSGLDHTLDLLQTRNGELVIAHQNTMRAEKLAAELEQKHRLALLRQRIARDLHDDIGSTLSEINIVQA